jgi:hypothetical protein
MAGQAPGSQSGVLVVGAAVLGLVGAGWFVLSHFVMNTGTADALGEALGVMLGVLVLVSVLGAIASSGGNHR